MFTFQEIDNRPKAKLVRFVMARAREVSTWRGIILAVSGLLGLTVNEDVSMHIVTIGVAAAGLVGVLFPDVAGQD